MSESEFHQRLVDAAVRAIEIELHNTPFHLWASQPKWAVHPAPFQVGGVQPDVIAVRRDSGFSIVGEAKTPRDIDNRHTRKQLKYYFEFLVTQPSGLLWISVPLGCGGEALRIAHSLRREFQCERVGLRVSEWMLGSAALETRWNG